jgi:hypothetical protein
VTAAVCKGTFRNAIIAKYDDANRGVPLVGVCVQSETICQLLLEQSLARRQFRDHRFNDTV